MAKTYFAVRLTRLELMIDYIDPDRNQVALCGWRGDAGSASGRRVLRYRVVVCSRHILSIYFTVV